MFLACIAYSHWLPYPKNKIVIHISMNSPVEPCSIVLISLCSSKSFGFFSPQLLAMLSTVASSRNLLRKQFSCELHIKRKKIFVHILHHLLFFICATLLLWEVLFSLVSLGFGGSLMFHQHSSHSGSSLAICLKHCTSESTSDFPLILTAA